MNDAELLEEFIRNGSEKAFRKIVEQYSQMVYAVCFRGLGSQADAEDAAQSVFIILAQKARSIRNRNALAGWLFRTARSAVLLVKRTEANRAKREHKAALMKERSYAPADAEIDRAEVAAHLNDALASLSRKQQEALVMHYYGNKTHRETANALGCSEDAVQKRISYGLGLLRSRLEKKKIFLSDAVLAGVLTSEAEQPVPGHIPGSCCTAAIDVFSGKAAAFPEAYAIAQGVLKMLMWMKIRIAVCITVCVLAAGGTAIPFIVKAEGGENVTGSAPAKNVSECTMLDANSFWRCRFFWRTYQVRMKSGESVFSTGIELVKEKGKKSRRPAVKQIKNGRCVPPPPQSTWTAVDFNDSSWGRFKGPFNRVKGSLGAFCLRGKFTVHDPSGVKDMMLDLFFRGGTVVYLNGREIIRSHLPEGEINLLTPADMYPERASVDAEGYLLKKKGLEKTDPEAFRMRTRRISGIKMDPALLRKGVNVLAVEIHRAPMPEILFTGSPKKTLYYSHYGPQIWWPMIGLGSIELTAHANKGSVQERDTVPSGFRVWNRMVTMPTGVSAAPDPNELLLKPVRICGTGNGRFCGKVAAGSDKPIRNIKGIMSDLKGPAVIPASAIEVRYALPDLPHRYRKKALMQFNSLESFPPDEVSVCKETGRAVQPIWVIVHVPADAKAGDYRGNLTVTADGEKPVQVPVMLQVAGWNLPAPQEFTTFMDLIQSPDSVAMYYKVPVWSDEHWELLEKNFSLIGRLGCKTLYIPLVARTHFGNAHSMVHWIKKDYNGYTHDFSVVEKYVDLALRHMGDNIPVICLYCWEPDKMGAHYAHGKDFGNRRILFSVLDPDTRSLKITEGPAWGTLECEEFWQPVMDGIQQILEKRDLADSMMVGICNDYNPSEAAVGSLTAAAPDAEWVVHSHVFWSSVRGRPVGYLACLWGLHGMRDPDTPALGGERRFYGWNVPQLISYFPRTQLRTFAPLPRFRALTECWVVAAGKYGKNWGGTRWSGSDGLGRVSIDFWNVVESKAGGRKGTLAGYYQLWGGFSIGSYGAQDIIMPGREGAIPSARYEMLREGVQECEARIFIEKAITDQSRRAKLGPDLAAHAQELLDERVRALVFWNRGWSSRWLVSSGWQNRAKDLYETAARVAEKLKK